MPTRARLASFIVHAICQAKRAVVIRMLVDTGATYTMIPRKAALAAGLDLAAVTRRTAVITASTVEYVPLLRVPVWRCLGIELRNVEMICHDLPPESAVDGLLGLDFLRHFTPFQRFQRNIHPFLVRQ